MTKKITPRIASGFPEYLPEEQIEFNRLLGIIRNTYESYGFAPIETPDLELRDVLLAKGGGETDQQVYDFTRGKNDFVMRFDLTVPLARYVAQYQNDLVFPFKRYAIGKVHRAERAQAGRFREFYQCDIDAIGSNSPIVDAEFPAIINRIFDEFNFGEFVIRLNDRRLLNGFFAEIGIDDSGKTNVMRIIDKVEKISSENFVAELTSIGLNQEQIDRLKKFISTNGNNDEILAQLDKLNIANDDFARGRDNLRTLVQAIRQLGVPEKRFAIDPKIARGLDYYTGTVYETFLVDFPQLGSVCSGGRYDNLTEFYTDTKLSGVGISIGLTRLFYQLKQAGAIKTDRKNPADVVILPMSENEIDYAIRVSAILRAANIANFLYTEQNSFKKKMQFADRMGFSRAIIIGGDEIAGESVSLKNMKTGDNENVKLDNLAKNLS